MYNSLVKFVTTLSTVSPQDVFKVVAGDYTSTGKGVDVIGIIRTECG